MLFQVVAFLVGVEARRVYLCWVASDAV